MWLNKRATNKIDGDMIIARKLALQWSGPFLYLRSVNDALGEICRQRDGQQTNRPFKVHLSKLQLYREPAAYPDQHADLFKPWDMRALGDGSTEADDEEDDALLQLPPVEMWPEDAAQERGDHLYRIPDAEQEVEDEIDWSHPQVPVDVKVRKWLGEQDPPARPQPKREKKREPECSRRETFLAQERVRGKRTREERGNVSRRDKPAEP